ncbi:MAG: diacylglycerol kinase family protein [Firmicutes bacterium]|nr:diacylglycerol kinase family protein [Bacillota bacterium]MDY5336386.1 diacylglycerol kinase family protein [Bacilli bacterium]
MLSRTKSKRKFSSSVKNCINGFKFININEDNFKREIFLGIIVLVLSYVFRVNKIEFIIIIIMIGLVLVCETINTVVERLVDLVSPGYNKIAGEVKDIMAFAVLLMCIISLVIGAIIFIPKIISLQGGI